MSIALNLLSPEKKRALQAGFLMAHIQSLIFVVMLLAILASGTLLSMRMLLQRFHEDLQRQSGPATDEFTSAAEDIKRINAYLSRIEQLDARFVRWSDVLARITAVVPAGIELEEIRLDSSRKILVRGVAETREDVLTFNDRLKALPFLSSVSSPLSNILQKKNVRFDFEMQYGPPPAPAK